MVSRHLIPKQSWSGLWLVAFPGQTVFQRRRGRADHVLFAEMLAAKLEKARQRWRASGLVVSTAIARALGISLDVLAGVDGQEKAAPKKKGK
jgi:hypothetical protein